MRNVLVGIGMLFLLTGCFIFGQGSSYGYITTVEDGFWWNRAYIRAELESSNTDCYVIKKSDDFMYDNLKRLAESKQRVEIQYERHVFTMSSECNNDEIVGYRVIENGINN